MGLQIGVPAIALPIAFSVFDVFCVRPATKNIRKETDCEALKHEEHRKLVNKQRGDKYDF